MSLDPDFSLGVLMKPIQIILALIFVVSSALVPISAQTAAIPLWENGAPNAVGSEPDDVPTITPYFPHAKATRAAIIVCPGGGYSSLSIQLEGAPIVEWLNSQGITAFLLRYRISPRYHQPAPLQDVTRAMRLVRWRAKEWDLDAGKIGILGFSAGGHLASSIGTHFDAGDPSAKDPIERVSSRPDLMALIYPVITMEAFGHPGSNLALLGPTPSPEIVKYYSSELQVKKDTPPAFVAHAYGDKSVPIENSLLFVNALRKAGVPFEAHFFDGGKHAFGLGLNDPVLGSWRERYLDWLRARSFLPKTTPGKTP
jgi:acetyl esterase/lipase